MNRDEFQRRMLELIDPDYDKSEGSFFYDVLKPVSIELEELDNKREENIKSFFVGNHKNSASNEILDIKALEIGLKRKQSKKARGYINIRAKEGTFVERNSIVTNEDGTIEFKVLESMKVDETNQAKILIEAIEAGKESNMPPNSIKYFKTSIYGVLSLTNKDIITGGEDRESDTELTKRYLDHVGNIVVYGNGNYYKKLSKDIKGIKDAIVYEVFDGPKTLKIVLIDENNRTPSKEKIDEVKEYIELYRMPCAIVSIEGCEEKSLDISLTLELKDGVDKEILKEEIESKIRFYLKNMDFKKAQKIRKNEIAKILLNHEDIIDYVELKINNKFEDIDLLEGEVGYLNSLTIN